MAGANREINRRALARLTKAMPDIFPSGVRNRALTRPFIAPTPGLAIDSYWRAHPLRADRQKPKSEIAGPQLPSCGVFRIGHDIHDNFPSQFAA